MPAVKVFFDGGCKPNPGLMEHGVVIPDHDVEHHERTVDGTNNVAEWLALLMAVELAAKLELVDVEFVGDSLMVINQASGKWRSKDKWAPYKKELDQMLLPFRSVKFSQVPRNDNLAGTFIERVNR